MISKKQHSKKSSESLAEFLDFWRKILSEYDIAISECSKFENATLDLLHQIELGPYQDRNKYATRLSNVRKARRTYKNYIDINERIYNTFRKSEFIKLYRELEQLLGEVRKKEKLIEGSRSYSPRVVDDLTIPITSNKETKAWKN